MTCRCDANAALLTAAKAVLYDLSVACETWRDSDAGPYTVPGESRLETDLDVSAEVIADLRAAIDAVEGGNAR